ncbi:MAG: Fe-S-containing hydro-lyase [Desulfovibrionaceae bacterium]
MTQNIDKRITTPFDQTQIRSLHIGDTVLITGTLIGARDATHKKLIEALNNGEKLPIPLLNQIIYYVGPSPAKPGAIIGSAGPTTSGRMDAYTPRLLQEGLKGIIGKGMPLPNTRQALKEHGAVYFAAVGGLGVLLGKKVVSYTIKAYPELGPEALCILEVVDFPVIVALDSYGANIYESNPKKYAKTIVL